MNLKEIKEMITLMNDNNLTELELEREGLKIRLRRGGMAAPNIVIERVDQPGQNVLYNSHTQQASQLLQAKPSEKSTGVEVKSPMVGTFYRAPSPDAVPFVEIGSEVEIGQVICIIEAMKLMNEIKSEVKGKVKEILIDNGDPIEFAQVLFRIEPK
ncbi:MAG: acetyl-CoA carboxylase biotin carboxyl carrier protein [Candidatus Omnitrophica bacterium]|nr:acetyl-CoA carboxylase biotin carboxyl carrier protein [Candidatus Omnitrophota bacterium]